MITAQQPHYYIQPDSIDIRYAEYAGQHKFTVGLREGSSVLVYYPGLDTLGYRDDGSYLSFKLEGAGNRYLKSLDNNIYYIYICFPRTFKAYGDTAYLAFLPTWIPITEDAPGPPVSEKARELMQDNIYICIGTFYSDDSYNLDTGALGTIAQQNAWQEKLNDVPMRIDVTYVLTGGSTLPNGETPHVDWGGNVKVTARLLQEWATDVTRLVDHWSIVRNSGDNVSDAAWNATATFNGEKTLLFNQTQNDLGTTGEKTEFTLTAYAADDSVLAIRTVLVTHTDMQAWIVDCDAPIGAINVDSLGNVKGGLWTEEEDDGDDDDSLGSEESETPMYRTYRLTLAVTVRRNALKGNDYLTIAADGQAPGPGEFQIYPQEGDCQLMVKNSTLYVTAINHIKDGVPGSGDEIWDDEEYKNMREMRYAEAAFIVNCEGLAAIPKTYRICINHDAAPYVAVEMAPATAEVTFDERYSNNNYDKLHSSFSGLPIPISLAAKFDDSPVKITGLVLGLDGMAPREGFTYQLSYHQSADPSDPLNGSIDGASITSLPKPDAARSLIGNYIVYLSLTAIYAGVEYERVMQFPIVERYKAVTSSNVRHFLLTANDDWGASGVPPYSDSGWKTNPPTTEVSELLPYLWIYDETVFSNGQTSNALPILMGNWAESAVTYFMDVAPGTVPTNADGSIKASAQNIVIVPYKRLGTGVAQRIHETGYKIIVTAYNSDGQQVGTQTVVSSTATSDFAVTWTPTAGAVRAIVKFTDANNNELCDSTTVPYVADGAKGSDAVLYYMVADPESLSLAAGGDTFADGSQSKAVTIRVYKVVGNHLPTLVKSPSEVWLYRKIGDDTADRITPISGVYTVTLQPTSVSLTLTLMDGSGTATLETKTITIQSAGLRGYQGASPRRREWDTDMTWRAGTPGDTWKDFCAIKDAAGVVHQFECIQAHVSDTTNRPLLANGNINPAVVYPGQGEITSNYLWREPTEQFDFVATNVLLSQQVLAESGAFNGLRVNFLTVDRNSYIGGFMFNTPYTLLRADLKLIVNPYNYGWLDYLMWNAASSDIVVTGKPDIGDMKIYKSLNIMFPDCGSSIVLKDSSLADYYDSALGDYLYDVNTLNDKVGDMPSLWPKPKEWPKYVYLTLPFYAPFNLKVGRGQSTSHVFTTDDVADVVNNPDSANPFWRFINPSSGARNKYTMQLASQMANAKALCHEYLGARITVRNEVTTLDGNITRGGSIVIYGVKGIKPCELHTPADVRLMTSYDDYDPWGRTSFFWRMIPPGDTDSYLPAKIPLMAARNTIEANRFITDGQGVTETFVFQTPDEFWPASDAYKDGIQISGQSAQVRMCTDFLFRTGAPTDEGSPDGYNRAAIFSRIYASRIVDSASRGAFLDPLFLADGAYGVADLSAFELLPGKFVMLEMTYDEGEYYWRIVNYGPIPGYNPPGNS